MVSTTLKIFLSVWFAFSHMFSSLAWFTSFQVYFHQIFPCGFLSPPLVNVNLTWVSIFQKQDTS